MEIQSDTTLVILRLINIILITLACTAWIIFYIRYKVIGAIAPLSWLVHVLIYGIVRFFTPLGLLNSDFMNIWTAILITHAVVLLLVSACLSIPGVKRNKEQNND